MKDFKDIPDQSRGRLEDLPMAVPFSVELRYLPGLANLIAVKPKSGFVASESDGVGGPTENRGVGGFKELMVNENNNIVLGGREFNLGGADRVTGIRTKSGIELTWRIGAKTKKVLLKNFE
ncbi:hypothetical protein KBC75_03700 [Candidatus Shapirobacteria bacterium]|nr:hypothetical protein [Candidatus Shapirobacteria bacterium]